MQLSSRIDSSLRSIRLIWPIVFSFGRCDQRIWFCFLFGLNRKHWLRNLFGCDYNIFLPKQPQAQPQPQPHPPSQPQPQQQPQPCILLSSYGGWLRPPYKYMIKYVAVAVAVAVAVRGGRAVAWAVPVAGLTKRFFNHIQKDFLINVSRQKWAVP